MDLYSVGEMLVDFLPGSEPGSYIRNAGGAPANAATAAARNGLEAAMCCSVGDDDFGRYLLGTLRENRVRCIRREPCREAVTTMAFVSLTEEGERSFTFVRKPGADMFLREEDVREADIRDTVIVHAGSCSLSASPAAEATAKALHLGREMGRLVSFDVNYRDMMWNGSQEACAAKVREILPDVDLLKISEEEADMLGGEAELPALMERYGLTLVVLTLGGQGARGYFRGRRLAVPGRRRLLGRNAVSDAIPGCHPGGAADGAAGAGGAGVRQRQRMALCSGQRGDPLPAHPAGDRAASGVNAGFLPKTGKNLLTKRRRAFIIKRARELPRGG